MLYRCARWRRRPALSGPVGGSVSCVLGVDVVVLGDGGVSSGAVGRHVSVGDVPGGGDMVLCGVDTVLSGAVSDGLCDLDRVSGGGDTVVSDVDTVVSGVISGGLCAHDRVSGCGDTDVSSVDTVVLSLYVCVTLTVCHQVP